MNLPPISEEILVLCMLLAFLVGIILGYAFKAREHEREIDAILNLTKKERPPKGPAYTTRRHP